jgi:hypothetical protein
LPTLQNVNNQGFHFNLASVAANQKIDARLRRVWIFARSFLADLARNG